jgi:hypothetical protein
VVLIDLHRPPTFPIQSAKATARQSLRPSTRPWCHKSPAGFRTCPIQLLRSKPHQSYSPYVDHH